MGITYLLNVDWFFGYCTIWREQNQQIWRWNSGNLLRRICTWPVRLPDDSFLRWLTVELRSLKHFQMSWSQMWKMTNNNVEQNGKLIPRWDALTDNVFWVVSLKTCNCNGLPTQNDGIPSTKQVEKPVIMVLHMGIETINSWPSNMKNVTTETRVIVSRPLRLLMFHSCMGWVLLANYVWDGSSPQLIPRIVDKQSRKAKNKDKMH